jgi:hypothetical protein
MCVTPSTLHQTIAYGRTTTGGEHTYGRGTHTGAHAGGYEVIAHRAGYLAQYLVDEEACVEYDDDDEQYEHHLEHVRVAPGHWAGGCGAGGVLIVGGIAATQLLEVGGIGLPIILVLLTRHGCT